MPVMRVELDSDRRTARKILDIHRAGRVHRESRAAAREEIWRRGRIPAAEPAFVGITNGEPVRLIYDVEVYFDTPK